MRKYGRFFLSLFGTLTVLITVFIASFSASCISENMSTYSDTLYSNSTINNLLSLRQEEQINKKYIGFRSSSSEYVLIISKDFIVNGKKVSANNCDVFVYDSDMGSSNATRYYSTTLSNVTFNVNHVVTSNFLKGSSKDNSALHQRYVIIFLVAIFAVVLFWLLRRFK